ncbi:MAG: hypothetical protein ACREQW_00285 [Candidatus Binatia bacterium]
MDFEKILQMASGGSTERSWLIGLVDSFFTILLHPFAFVMIVGTLAHVLRCFNQTFRGSM